MESAEHTAAQWQTLRSQPAAFTHARRIVHAFDGLIGDEHASKLREEARFRDRLSALLIEAYAISDDFGDDVPSAPGRSFALTPSAELEALVRQFGAVYWARTIVGAIEATAVVPLKQRLGEDCYAAAIAHRDLAGPECAPADQDLGDAVTSAGLRCLAAWCARQPAGIAQRIRLKLPGCAALDGPVEPPFDEAGPRIVDRLTA
jgi:YOP proteins translocation protein K (YscK)